MKAEIDGELHEVVYIDYYMGGIPHQVITTHYIAKSEKPYWRVYWWDFFANEGDKSDIRYINTGSGGSREDGYSAPQWADGYIGIFWCAVDFKLKGEVKNGKRLKNPKRLKGWRTTSINPFKISEETNHYEFCERCGHDSTETCWEHKYEDDKGDLRYIETNEPAE